MVWFEKLISNINIGPLTYRNILAPDGGPIQEIKSCQLDSGLYEAYAYLKSQMTATNSNILYGDCDGTGTSAQLWEAQAIAISEALERWAFYECRNLWKDKIPSSIHSTGFAAFPGLNSKKVRENALSEALERWTLAQLALGRKLGFQKLSLTEGVELRDGMSLRFESWGREFVLLRQEFQVGAKKVLSYGFSCDLNRNDAVRRAKIEMHRNQAVLNKFYLNPKNELKDLFEKRVIHFSYPENDFLKKTTDSFGQISKLNKNELPVLIIDESLPGPWTQYAKVWRCFFELPSECLDKNKVDFFWF